MEKAGTRIAYIGRTTRRAMQAQTFAGGKESGIYSCPMPTDYRRIYNAGHATQRKYADNYINKVIFRREALPGQLKKFHVSLSVVSVLFSKSDHSRVGLKSIKPAHLHRIETGKIRHQACANLQKLPLSQTNHVLADFFGMGNRSPRTSTK